MATATAKKSRTALEVVPQLTQLPERVSILETKVENINEKLVELKADVKEMHDCLDNTRDLLAEKLEKMQEEYRANSSNYFDHADKLHAEDIVSHGRLSDKVSELEKFKNKWTMYVMLLLAFGAGTGWLGHLNVPMILKFVGI
jgi:uncharacterized coiled-coil protein SlyX